VDNGSITNTGTVTATPPSGGSVTDSSTLKVPAVLGASIGIQKSASIASYSAAGTPVTYSYLVTNSGNVTLDSVTVTDPMPGLSSVSCPDTALGPGATETCTATYTTTLADVLAGSITNTGTVTGEPPTGPAVTNSSTLTIRTASSGGGSTCGTTLKGFTPKSGPAGTVITITGTNFSTAYLVGFQGTEAFVTSAKATTVTVTVPANTMTGPITVYTHACGSAESDIDKGAGGIFKATSPAIVSLSASAGRVGSDVTIQGANLKKATRVSFNGTTAKIDSDNATQIVVTVPAGAKSGTITVTTKAGSTTSPETFTVT
ncbi:MAG TPA: IPT/TIG domain-containing protein, partial [Acidimicrobiales bacterium]|nr:IPT/TIG domain-containing protein [Acidimicrobiales bacterium]